MSVITCTNIIQELNKSIDKTNYLLIDHMTEPDMQYAWACIKPNLTYEYFYDTLKQDWEKIINEFIKQPNNCGIQLSGLFDAYRNATPEKIEQARNIFNAIFANDINGQSKITSLKDMNLDNIALDVAASSILNQMNQTSFVLDPNFMNSMVSLSRILVDNCQCQMADIYKVFVENYKKKYFIKFEGKSKDEVIDLLRKDYSEFKSTFKNLTADDANVIKSNLLDRIANKFTGLYGFSVGPAVLPSQNPRPTVSIVDKSTLSPVESELDRLIPDELGSLKQFFIKVISKYYNELHPIVWAQIFKGFTENVFVDLPFTPDELFSFASKQLLLNSGPFILKILQMIKPVLSPELAQKYNLTKLTYPQLKPNEIELILKKVVYDWDMYIVLQNFSASVGHVSKVVKVNDPSNPFIIKIIKPLAVAQSCWEYKTLYDVYPPGTCEQAFIINMLESNGRELNVQNEINNINKGHDVYTATYREIFDVDIDAKLTAVENIPGIIHPASWYALTMTVAPGVALSKLIENDELKEDTKYRAKLHRCLDILVFKFFHNIVKNGYYHGDLHSGNIFYSYDDSQMTLIDFGAVGEIDIYDNDPDMRILLDIVVMSIFYNYDEMLDTMTVLLNKRCTETQIDMNSESYLKLKKELYDHKINNIQNQEKEKKKAEIYKQDIFSEARIQEEKSGSLPDQNPSNVFNPSNINSIYSYLEYKPAGPETIVENKDTLPVFTEILGDSESITFSGVLEKIIKYYALSGVNIAIKFSEFYEFQKAYALILGVLHKVGYNSYRTGIAIKRAIVNWSNLTEVVHVGAVGHVVKKYWEESGKYDELKKRLDQGSTASDLSIKNRNVVTDNMISSTKNNSNYIITKKSLQK